MDNSKKNFLTLSHIHKIIVILILITSLAGAQDSSREQVPLSFVFLPLRASQLYQVEVEQFMDEFIKELRMRGHNAVSTRYLKSVLLDSRLGELDACTTQVCMSQVARLVGTRFLIHGSLYLDSLMRYIVNVKVIDVPNSVVMTMQQDSVPKNPGITTKRVVEFTDKILNSITTALLQANGVHIENSPVAGSSTSGPAEMAIPSADTIAKSSDTSGPAFSSTVISQNLIIDSLGEQVAEKVSDTSTAIFQVDTVMTIVANDSIISNNDEETGRVLDTAKTVLAVSVPPPVSLTISQQDYQSSGPAAPPEALKRENVRKKLKIVRVSTFGTIALAAFAGGIVINRSVKKSLVKESVFFNDYMQADAHSADAAYQAYILQAEKTDAKMRQRSFLYTLSVLGLAGGVISFNF